MPDDTDNDDSGNTGRTDEASTEEKTQGADDGEFDNKFVQEYIDKQKLRLSETSVGSYKSALRRYLSFLDGSPTEVTYADVEDFADSLAQDDCRAKTIENYVSVIRNFHAFLNRRYQMNMPALDGIRGSNYKNVPPATNRKSIPRDDIAKMFDSTESIRETLIVGLPYYANCRRGEIPPLELGDVDLDERRILIRNSKHGKTRVTSFHEEFRWPLEVWMNQVRRTYPHASDSEYLIVGKRKASILPIHVYLVVREVAERAGIQEIIGETARGRKIRRVTPHTLRHSFATHAREDGMDLIDIKKLMGHSKTETTLGYIDENADDVIEKYQEEFQGLR